MEMKKTEGSILINGTRRLFRSAGCQYAHQQTQTECQKRRNSIQYLHVSKEKIFHKCCHSQQYACTQNEWIAGFLEQSSPTHIHLRMVPIIGNEIIYCNFNDDRQQAWNRAFPLQSRPYVYASPPSSVLTIVASQIRPPATTATTQGIYLVSANPTNRTTKQTDSCITADDLENNICLRANIMLVQQQSAFSCLRNTFFYVLLK